MKIVVDCRMYSFSGIGRYIKDIIPGLCEHFESVILLGKPEELAGYKKYPSVTIIAADAKVYSIKEQFQLAKIIPKCDIFLSPHYNVPIFKIKAKKRITTIHDAYPLAFFNELSLPKKIYAKIFFGGAMRLSDKIITISQFSKNELIKYTAKKYASKIEVIYRFVGDVIDSQQNIKEQASAKKDEQFFLFVGNVKPNKNLKNALLGFKHAITNNKNLAQNCIFTIVGKKDGFITGDPEISAMIEKDVVLQEKVQFTGHMSDKELIGLYQHALALVFPSYYEGFGLPPLEAMYFGCPTICSNAASIPEICGDASLYFNPSVPAEIGEKMMDIYSSPDLRESLKEKGTRQVNKYSKETAIKEHLRLFDNLMLN